MPQDLYILLITAVSVGFIHALAGPDHYVPFIAMAKAAGWSKTKTFLITFFSGLAHIFSAILLAFAGILFSMKLSHINAIESLRGNVAGWALIAFGLAYFVWGLRRVFKGSMESKKELKAEGTTKILPWILFTMFIFGPCEPLIPIIMCAAAKTGMAGAILVSAVFGAVTVGMMLSIVMVASFGINLIPFGKLEKFSHALAGATICLCGMAIQFLGL